MEQSLVGSLFRGLSWIGTKCSPALCHSTLLSLSLCPVLTPWLGQDPLQLAVPRPHTIRWRWFLKEESGVDPEKEQRKGECLVVKFQWGRMIVPKPFHLLINDYLSFSSYWSVIENQAFSPTWTLFSFLYICTTIKNNYSYWIPFHHCPLHQKSVFQIPMTSTLPELMNPCTDITPLSYFGG